MISKTSFPGQGFPNIRENLLDRSLWQMNDHTISLYVLIMVLVMILEAISIEKRSLISYSSVVRESPIIARSSMSWNHPILFLHLCSPAETLVRPPSLTPRARAQTWSSSQETTDCTRVQGDGFEEERNPEQHPRGHGLLCQLGAACVDVTRQAKWWWKVENLPHVMIPSSSSEIASPPFSPASTKMLFVTHTTF